MDTFYPLSGVRVCREYQVDSCQCVYLSSVYLQVYKKDNYYTFPKAWVLGIVKGDCCIVVHFTLYKAEEGALVFLSIVVREATD